MTGVIDNHSHLVHGKPMYVCVCKAVTESRIRRAVAEGAVSSLRDLRNSHGLGTGCGKCVPQAHEFLKGCLEEKAREAPVPHYGACRA